MKNFLILLTALICNATYAQQKQIQYLSGKGSDHTVAWEFYCTGGRNSGYWTRIQVPSCWEQQGFGTYNYGRDYKTYGRNFRFADEKGHYKYSFTVPASWKGKEVSIVFEGSMTDTDVKINGKPAGATHRGAFYRFKYNITDKLNYGAKNLLEVTVSKMSSEPTVNNAERLADYWVFGGIFRPVWLEAVNKEFIDYVGIDAKDDGTFALQVNTRNINMANNVVADILDSKGIKVGSVSGKLKKNDSTIILKAHVDKPLQWTSESPHLYKLNVYLKEGSKTLYSLSEKFGFRTIEVRHGDGIYVNGTQVKMKGVNRHCFWPETGRTLSDAVQLKDVLLIKEMNMNAVRCSHYPPDKRFLEYCDSLGLYVIDELAGWQKAYSTDAGRPLVREMVTRDLNHPSIIFWANGNEGGTNKNLDGDFYRWDFSQRPVIHPHHRPGNAFNGIDCDHYEDYYSTQRKFNDSLIYMPTEFLHSQDDGGGGSAMYDFWNLHWKAKRSGGGFIWAMLDEGLVRTDLNNIIDANGINANDGVLGPHREKEGSFFALREIFSPVHIEMPELPENFDGAIELENRYHFTDLKDCAFQWTLVNFVSVFDMQVAGNVAEKRGTANCPSILPLQKGKLSLNLPAGYKNYDALQLKAVDKFGKEIYTWSWKLKHNAALLTGTWGKGTAKTGMEESDSVVVLTADNLRVTIDKFTGQLVSARNSVAGMDNLCFSNGPVLTEGKSTVKKVFVGKSEAVPGVQFDMDGPMKSIRWTMQNNGWVRLDYTYELHGSYPFAGVSFNYPENYILTARWLGKGPYRQWKNRTAGTPIGVWQNAYNNTQTGYSPIIYPEFKGYYGEITWMEFNTVEGRFYVASEQEGLNVRLFNFYGLTGAKPFPELPPGDISFLDCIPPMGTKLAFGISRNTSSLGPQSEPTRIDGPINRTLYFYFGQPKMTDIKELYSRPKVDNVF
jgi:hypothetical protein